MYVCIVAKLFRVCSFSIQQLLLLIYNVYMCVCVCVYIYIYIYIYI